jgi:hypothetical protein
MVEPLLPTTHEPECGNIHGCMRYMHTVTVILLISPLWFQRDVAQTLLSLHCCAKNSRSHVNCAGTASLLNLAI